MSMDLSYEVYRSWADMFGLLSKEQQEKYLESNTFRACFMSNYNFVFDSVCTLKLEDDKHISIHIQDGNRMRDKDCDRIDILGEDDVTIIRLNYHQGTFIQEYGTIGLTVRYR